MGLRFILGRAGAGKTRQCLEEIRDALAASPWGSPLVFLVPDQATWQVERQLLEVGRASGQRGLAGFMRAQVLSFRRLARLVCLRTGVTGGRRPLGELGRLAALQAILDQAAPELTVLGEAAGRPGLVERLARLLRELKAYRQEPARLSEALARLVAAGQGDSLLACKLADLYRVASAYQEWLRTAGFVEPEDEMAWAAERLAATGLFAGARVWLDGFAGFTPQEYALLGALLGTVAEVSVALCLDGRWAIQNEPSTEGTPMAMEAAGLFAPTWRTYVALRQLAARLGIPVTEVRLLDDPGRLPPRFSGAPELAHLEAHFGAVSPPVRKGSPWPRVRLVEAANRRTEVEAAAREIDRLCREEGYRYREIAVMVRSLEPYHDLIRATFQDYGIPCFIDRKEPFSHHPLAELIRAALQLAGGWESSAVLRAARTGLLAVDQGAVDELENYVLAHPVSSSQWQQGFQQATASVEAARQALVAALCPWLSGLAGVRTVLEMSAALVTWLEGLQVAGRLEAWAQAAEAAGQLERAQGHRQAYGKVVSLLEELVEALGERATSWVEFRRWVEVGLERLQVGLIPPALDQVLVGAVERSRSPDLRAVFVLGAVEGEFPAVVREDYLLTDSDREALTALGVELAPVSTVRADQEQFLAYIALTRPSERLWLSYPLADEAGRALVPSLLARRLRQLFPDLVVEQAPLLPPPGVLEALPWVTSPERLIALTARQLRRLVSGEPIPADWQEAYELIATSAALASRARRVMAALGPARDDRPLPKELTAQLYPNPWWVSVSQLERFAACPFRHFAEDLLRLQPREVWRVEPADLGQLAHEVLRQFVVNLQRSGIDWSQLGDEEAYRLVDQLVDQLVPQLREEILLSSARSHYVGERLRRAVRAAVWALGEHARRGAFRPVATEVWFGPKDGEEEVRRPGPGAAGKAGPALPPWLLRLPDGRQVGLRGRIDRLDLAQGPGGERYLRVVDYKSSNTRFRVDRLAWGLSLQLLTYLRVASRAELAAGPLEPAGAFYLAVRDPIVTLRPGEPADPEAIRARRLKELRMHGPTLGDPAVMRLMDSEVRGDLVPGTLKKDGEPAAHELVLRREQFTTLFEALESVIIGLAVRMTAGEVAPGPYRFAGGGDTACRFCPYRPVCHFDPLYGSDRYRFLPQLAARQRWGLLAQVVRGVSA